jgi:hypothetical protein
LKLSERGREWDYFPASFFSSISTRISNWPVTQIDGGTLCRPTFVAYKPFAVVPHVGCWEKCLEILGECRFNKNTDCVGCNVCPKQFFEEPSRTLSGLSSQPNILACERQYVLRS